MFLVGVFFVQNEERFLPGFRSSVSYVKLLAELDLLKDPSSRSDEEDSQSLDEISLSDNISLSSFDADFTLMEGATGMKSNLMSITVLTFLCWSLHHLLYFIYVIIMSILMFFFNQLARFHVIHYSISCHLRRCTFVPLKSLSL